MVYTTNGWEEITHITNNELIQITTMLQTTCLITSSKHHNLLYRPLGIKLLRFFSFWTHWSIGDRFRQNLSPTKEIWIPTKKKHIPITHSQPKNMHYLWRSTNKRWFQKYNICNPNIFNSHSSPWEHVFTNINSRIQQNQKTF